MTSPLEITIRYGENLEKKRYYVLSYFPVLEKEKASGYLYMVFKRILNDLKKGVFEL